MIINPMQYIFASEGLNKVGAAEHNAPISLSVSVSKGAMGLWLRLTCGTGDPTPD
jgi:hypothetical protein